MPPHGRGAPALCVRLPASEFVCSVHEGLPAIEAVPSTLLAAPNDYFDLVAHLVVARHE